MPNVSSCWIFLEGFFSLLIWDVGMFSYYFESKSALIFWSAFILTPGDCAAGACSDYVSSDFIFSASPKAVSIYIDWRASIIPDLGVNIGLTRLCCLWFFFFFFIKTELLFFLCVVAYFWVIISKTGYLSLILYSTPSGTLILVSWTIICFTVSEIIGSVRSGIYAVSFLAIKKFAWFLRDSLALSCFKT